MLGVDTMLGRFVGAASPLWILYFHEVEHDGSIRAFDQHDHLMAYPLVDQRRDRFLPTRSADLIEPSSEHFNVLGVDVSHGRLNQVRSLR